MNLPFYSGFVRASLILACSCFAVGLARAGSDTAQTAVVQDARPIAAQMDDYLKAQHIEHSIDAPTPANGQTTTVKIYGVTATPQQEALCAGLSAGEKHDRLQGISVQFLSLETHPTGTLQTFQPSSLPSGNGSATTVQRPAEKTDYKVQRTVKLQELVAK